MAANIQKFWFNKIYLPCIKAPNPEGTYTVFDYHNMLYFKKMHCK